MKHITLPEKRKKSINYGKWGYLFITPFFVAYLIFSLIPLCSTFYYSFFERYLVGLDQIGPNFVGFENYKTLLTQGDFTKYLSNTFVIWILGFIPQIVVSLMLAAWFTDLRLRLRALGLFKTIIYMPNLIMAAAFSMLFFTIFADAGPVNNLLLSMGMPEVHRFFADVWSTRGLIALMNFLMWYGNTTILLMAAIMGIDPSLFEAAQIDGASGPRIFRQVTLPLIKPILIYVMITSLIGGLQMFDVPQILTNSHGNPNRTSMTLVMYLNKHLFSENFGMGGAVSVVLFLISALLSVLVYFAFTGKTQKGVSK